MKLRKIIGLLILVLIGILVLGTTNVYAADSNYVLGITNVREAQNGKLGGAYEVKPNGVPIKVWKIVSYPTSESTKIDYSNAFYCLKAGHGFMTAEPGDVSTIKKLYNTRFDMKKQKDNVMQKLNSLDVFKSDPTSYNKVMWIVDNMYLAKAEGAAEFKEALLKAAGIVTEKLPVEHVSITDDDIEIVQQLAIWYFTNYDFSENIEIGGVQTTVYNYRNEELPILFFNNYSGKDENYISIEDLYNNQVTGTKDGLRRQLQCESLYRYLLENAKTKGDYVSPDTTSPLTLDKSRVALNERDSDYLIGPFKVNKNSDVLYTLKQLGFKDQNGDKFDYTLLDENKVEVENDISKLYGKDFYISIPLTTQLTSIKFDIGLTYSATTANYYTTDEATYLGEQPVMLVERNPLNYEDKITVTMPEAKDFDLALRKFITKVNGVEPQISRQPVVDLTNLKNGTSTTAIYNHSKTPLSVEVGDIVTYTIRVYNEGAQDGYVSEITDHLPPQLEFLPDDDENIANGWVYDENDVDLRTIKTTHLSKQTDSDNLIKAFDGEKLDYKDITIKCKVKDNSKYEQRIVNIADITGFTDKNGNAIVDIDSQEGNVNLPTDENLPLYKEEEIKRGDKYIPGQQDDDDFDNVNIVYFDLALRKFITKVDNLDVNNRYPVLSIDKDGNIKYTHTKEPVLVRNGNIVTYTIRVYNEGKMDGYAKEVTDDLPEGLLFLSDNDTNKKYRWTMIDKDGKQTQDITKASKVTTDYLSKEQESQSGSNLIKSFNSKEGITDTNPDYRDVKIAFKVIEPNKSDRILINTAEISDDSDKNGNEIDDIDSTPGNNVDGEDDIDIDKVKVVYFDLALRKFITKVDNLDVNNRYPVLSVDKDGDIKYTHTKEPVLVANGNIVTYTIRIYNEGKMDGYAKEITDDLPQGLLFLPDNDTNKTYRWTMIDKDGNQTQDVTKASKVTTDYLSKEQEEQQGDNLIKSFNPKEEITDTNPDHKDVKISFKITEPNTSDRILINTAEISDDSDKDGNEIDDIDSTPDNNIDGEDDIDIDKVKVKYFDLALKKWVTQAIVIEGGKQTVTESGHTGDENPEPVVKVDLKAKDLNKVTVKFRYKIKVTNEGQLEGYVKELKDYIPDGLKFVAEDNKNWKQISDKVVTTDQLKDTLLKPGESATVEIVLTWINSEDNLGLKVNTAEISKDYNEYGDTDDIDSTPDNKKPGEDDIDDAPVILSIKTGQTGRYIGLVTIICGILAGGVYLIKKYVL